MAKEFDSGVKTELRILKDFEDTLRELGPIADDLETISEQLTEHKVSKALSHHKPLLLRTNLKMNTSLIFSYFFLLWLQL